MKEQKIKGDKKNSDQLCNSVSLYFPKTSLSIKEIMSKKLGQGKMD